MWDPGRRLLKLLLQIFLHLDVVRAEMLRGNRSHLVPRKLSHCCDWGSLLGHLLLRSSVGSEVWTAVRCREYVADPRLIHYLGLGYCCRLGLGLAGAWLVHSNWGAQQTLRHWLLVVLVVFALVAHLERGLRNQVVIVCCRCVLLRSCRTGPREHLVLFACPHNQQGRLLVQPRDNRGLVLWTRMWESRLLRHQLQFLVLRFIALRPRRHHLLLVLLLQSRLSGFWLRHDGGAEGRRGVRLGRFVRNPHCLGRLLASRWRVAGLDCLRSQVGLRAFLVLHCGMVLSKVLRHWAIAFVHHLQFNLNYLFMVSSSFLKY